MMYDLLLQLPLFQGMSQEQLLLILEKVPFHFRKFHANESIVREGEKCNDIIFVLSGRVRMITPTFNSLIKIEEDFVAPHTIPFTNLFGSTTVSRFSVCAQGQAGAMFLDKSNFLKLMEKNRVMLVNALNILSANAQKRHSAMDSLAEKDPMTRLASWLIAYTSYSARNISIYSEAKDLCSMLNMKEEDLHQTIVKLQEDGFIEAGRENLKLIDRYGLRSLLTRNAEIK